MERRSRNTLILLLLLLLLIIIIIIIIIIISSSHLQGLLSSLLYAHLHPVRFSLLSVGHERESGGRDGISILHSRTAEFSSNCN